jgi:hypothetical protein
MTEDDYTVRGCTALIDALGSAIHHIGNIHKYARKNPMKWRETAESIHKRVNKRLEIMKKTPFICI